MVAKRKGRESRFKHENFGATCFRSGERFAMKWQSKRVMIYRLGSLGDTVVALPALRRVATVFPEAQRMMLTNFSVSEKAAQMSSVLEGTGLVDGYLEYPIRLRGPRAIWALWRRIRSYAPDVLVYLAEPRGRWKVLRDLAFFRLCGVRRIVGRPTAYREGRPPRVSEGWYEFKGATLLRRLEDLGTWGPDREGAYRLDLSDAELEAAGELMGARAASRPVLAVSIGAKVDVKDWGDENWACLLSRLNERLGHWTLIMFGSADEFARSEALSAGWSGGSVNLCGKTSVRMSAAVLKRASLYLGHDSGPMHLAAAVGTPCVAIFSARNWPGEWFPQGEAHEVIYHSMPCQGCRLSVCAERDKQCIRSIGVDEVEHAVERVLTSSRYGRDASVEGRYGGPPRAVERQRGSR